MNGFLKLLAGLFVGLGFAAGGFFAGEGFKQGRVSERIVTVKGISEREVDADLAIWYIGFAATDDDLAVAQRTLEDNRAKVMTFLQGHDIDPASVELQGIEVNDKLADAYMSGPIESRFVLKATIVVHSSDPTTIKKTSEQIGELVAVGVVLSRPMGPYWGPTYLYTRLNEIKPEMIAEATKRAREAAEQFATDSGSTLGAIRRANQGVFEILPRNQTPGVTEDSEYHKKVRVVSTVEFLLKD